MKMINTIKARFTDGVFEPLEKIELPEGKEFIITISDVTEKPEKKRFKDALDSTAGAWKGMVDCDELIKNIYADRLISTRKIPKL